MRHQHSWAIHRSILTIVVFAVVSLLAGCAPAEATTRPTPEPIAQTPTLASATEGERVANVFLCQEAFGKSRDQVRAELLVAARKRALQQLYGETVSAVTTVESFQVVQDRIEAVTSSQILILSGNPVYGNSEDVGDVCITATFTVDEQAFHASRPQRRESLRICKMRSDSGTENIIDYTVREAKLAVLHDYEPRLRGIPDSGVLELLADIQYKENDFAGAETYCVRLSGVILPSEVQSVLDAITQPSAIVTSTATVAAMPSGAAATAIPAQVDPGPSATIAKASIDNLCVVLAEFDTRSAAEAHLLSRAESQAADMLYGVVIDTESVTMNFELLRDEVRRLTAGRIRPAVTPKFSLIDDGRLCISATYIATQEDLASYALQRIEGEAFRDASTAGEQDIRQYTKDQAELVALRDLDRRLRCVPDVELLMLLRNVDYTADRELPNTTTYHIAFVGYLIPAELERLAAEFSDCQILTSTSTPTLTNPPTPTDTPLPTDTPTLLPLDTPTLASMDTPTPTPTDTPTPKDTPTQAGMPTPMATAKATQAPLPLAPPTKLPIPTVVTPPAPAAVNYGTVTLISPPNGIEITTSPVTLTWQPVANLRSGDHYVVAVKHGPDWWDWTVVDTTAFAWDIEDFAKDDKPESQFTWYVGVCGGAPPGGYNDNPCTPISGQSEQRTFKWAEPGQAPKGVNPPPPGTPPGVPDQ